MKNSLEYKSTKVSKATYLFFLVLAFSYSVFGNANAVEGKEIYKNNCQFCHGKSLHGDMPGVPDLVINSAWTIKPDFKVHKLVKEGTEASGNAIVMPSQGGNPYLTDEQIKSALQYMRETIKKEREYNH